MNCVGKTFIHNTSRDIITCEKLLFGLGTWGETEYYSCTIKNEEKDISDFIFPTNLLHKMIVFKELEENNE